MRLLLILLLTLQINSLKADEIFNLLKIPNLDVYKLNNSNGLKYLNTKKNFKIGFENNITCNKANKKLYFLMLFCDFCLYLTNNKTNYDNHLKTKQHKFRMYSTYDLNEVDYPSAADITLSRSTILN